MDDFFAKTVFVKLLEFICKWSICVCLLLITTNVFATSQPVIISSVSSKFHQLILKNISSNLEDFDIKFIFNNIDKHAIPDDIDELIISIGNEAALALDKKNITAPQLRVLTEIDTNKNSGQKNKFYLSMTLPVCQQFALIKSLNAEWKNVSVLLADTNNQLIRKLESCAKQYKLTLNVIILNQYVNISDALNTSLLSSDVLLALPDPAVYNSRTVKNILLTTYRHRVPVIGFSESFVNAGALVAIHSSAKQLGNQIAELIKEYYRYKSLRKTYIFPKYFNVTINKNVAKSLGIGMPDAKKLKENILRK